MSTMRGGVRYADSSKLPQPVSLKPYLKFIFSRNINEERRALELRKEILRGSELDQSVLIASVVKRSLYCVEVLFDTQAPIDVNYRDSQGNTALHYCLRGIIAREDFFQVLLENGASINVPNSIGLTPAHYALFSPTNIFGLFVSVNFSARSFTFFHYLKLAASIGLTVSQFDTLLLLKRIYYNGGQLAVCERIRKFTRPGKLVDDWLKEMSMNVFSLKHLARLKIRSNLTAEIQNEVKKLSVPLPVQDYILMRM